MKKRIVTFLLTAVTALALAGCGVPVPGASGNPSESSSSSAGTDSSVGYPDEDGFADGYLGDTMHSYFFDYTVNSAYTCNEYEGYTPQEGNQLLVAEVTVRNTFRETLTMFDTDFQVQWTDTSDDAYDWPITYYVGVNETIGEDVLPSEYDLSVNESRTGLLIYEVPEGEKDFSISYLEYFDDDSTGNTFFVYFTAKNQ